MRLALVVLLATAAPLAAQSAPTRALDPANIDRAYGACQDFFMFANNGWIAKNPIPDAFSGWGTFTELSERNTLVLKGIVERAAAVAERTSDQSTKKLGTFYASCMDSTAADRAGVEPVADELRRIDRIADRAQLRAELAHMHALGFGGAFGFGAAPDARNATMVMANATQGGLGLPDRDYYLRADTGAQSLRDRYLRSMATMFTLAGDPAARATARAARVLDLETALAKAQQSRVALRDPRSRYNPMRLAEADSAVPGFDWASYLSAVGVPSVTTVNISSRSFFKTVGLELETRSLDDWQSYLRWVVLSRTAAHLSTPFVDEAFKLSSMLSGARVQQPRWKRCLVTTDQSLGDALGREYVKTAFTPEAKSKMEEIVRNLRGMLRERIQRADWMSDTTRVQALKKLDSFSQKIGYPDTWRDYAEVEIRRGPPAANVLRVRAAEARRDMNRIGKPVDRSPWLMTPPTVNAYYSPSLNEIVFPAGRLQPPFFSPSYDDAANYGGIGGTIGHEMSHGFDDSGRQYDAQGNLRDWWTAEDARRYSMRASMVERQYGAYVVIDTLHLNGRLTLGENLADVVGVSLAYDALERVLDGTRRQSIDGFTPEQRFFLAYAQARLTVLRPEQARLFQATDPHSPGKFRVNGPLSNIPEFAKAFGCKPGDPMVRAESDRAKIW
ncbi:MAG: M13 family metallopeptidase [bacterium]